MRSWHSRVNDQTRRLDAKIAALDAYIASKNVARDLVSLGFTMHEATVHLDIPYLAKGLFDKGQILVMWGKPGSGKTFSALSMAAHIGAGATWCGRRTKKGRVLYICAESTRRHLENRVAALKASNPTLAESEVVFVPISADVLHGMQDIEDIIRAAKAMGDVALIVIDTLSVTFGGGNENAPEDMSQYVVNVKRIRDETGSAVLIVHHGGKDDSRGMRGHSSLIGAIDGELVVEIDGNAVPGQADRILRTGKLREGESNTDLCAFRLEVHHLGVDSEGDAVTTCIMAPALGAAVVRKPTVASQARLLAALEADYLDGQTRVWTEADVRALAKGFMHRNSVTKCVLALVSAGFLKHSVGGYILGHPVTR